MIISSLANMPQINIDALNDETSTSDTSSINSTGGHFPFSTYTLDTTLNTILDADNSEYSHIVNTGTDAFHFGIGVGYDINNSGGLNHRMQIINITGDIIYEDELDWLNDPDNLYAGRDCDDYSSNVFTVSCGSVVSTYDEENEMIYFAYLICSTGNSNWQNRFGSGTSNMTACTDNGFESEGGILKISSLNTISKTVNQIGTITYSNCGAQWVQNTGTAMTYPSIYRESIKLNANSGSLFMTYIDKNQPPSSGGSFGLNMPNLYCDVNLNGTQIYSLGGSSYSNHQGTTYYSAPMLQSFQFDVSATNPALLRYSTLKSNHVNPTLLVGKYAITTGSSSLDCYNLETGSNEKTISRSSSITGYSIDDHQQYYPGNFTLLQSNEGVDLVDTSCSIVKSWDYSNSRGNANNYLLTWWSNSTSIFVSGYSDSFGGALNYSTNVPSKFFAIFDSNGMELSFVSESDTYWRDQGSRSLPIYKKIAHYGTSKVSPNGLTLPDNDNDDYVDYYDTFPYESTQWSDIDNDGYGDNYGGYQYDECVNIFGTSFNDVFGCVDSDSDGYSNSGDDFDNDLTQYLDSDSDGYGDNLSGFQGDACPTIFGESSRNSTYGCVDVDFDGWADFEDLFPNDSSQWSDWDGDGFGDELIGYEGDSCPSQYGNSTNDRYGCLDDDGDGWSNAGDDFISNPTQYSDVDGDGYGDNQSTGATMSDAFPNDGTQWNDTDGDGHGDNQYGNQGDWFPNDPSRWQDSDGDGYADEDDAFINDASQWNDSDGDGYGDEANGNQADAFPNDPFEWQDSDGDGYGNNADAFPVDGTQWNDTDGDGHGDNPYGTQGDWFPNDPNRWQDSDRDGYADEDDAFVNDASQWNDSDGDGYGDEANGNRADEFPDDPLEWQDSDGDGYGNNADAFPVDGTQWNDTDGDGYGDNPYGTQGDWFPNDPNRWQDSDRDGYADEDDLFPNEITQWNDTDGDGYGDNLNGNNGDVFPDDSSEWKDSDEDGVGNNADQYPYDPTQTVDSDGDGYGDNTNGTRGDVFPQDGTEWSDLDGDGIGNNADLFPSDGTQWNDTDSDGYGDNVNGANGDSCPLINGNSSVILLGCTDSDGDGYADLIDAFISNALSWSDVDGDSIPDELDAYPNDATQSFDSDGDGFGDDPLGTNADKFPNDSSQWNDIDGDGFGDNLDGNNPDLFKTDATQWADSDGDGYGDNPQGRLYDMFPDNPTQWLDEDGDGLGDNQSGTDADPYLDDFDNDGYNDSIDILPKLASPGDLDADGCLDEVDNFTADPNECLDTDGDGVGNNADSDDDGDGWTDADEDRLGTDSLSSGEQPIDSFEIVIPGTAVGLGAWDLIGIFGGVPLFAWLAFGFATRNSRCGRYEDLLNQANSRDELEQVALRWEYSLMLRMLGPHQGIRLERLRAELDDKFENTEPEEIGVNQTSIVEREAKQLPPIEAKSEIQSTPSKDTPATSTDEEGYEWLKDESGIDWYRAADSGDEWAKFES
jgi:hypothetical protein